MLKQKPLKEVVRKQNSLFILISPEKRIGEKFWLGQKYPTELGCNQIRCTARTLKESQQKALIWNKERPAIKAILPEVKLWFFLFTKMQWGIFLFYIFHSRVCLYILMMSTLPFVFMWSGFWCRQEENIQISQIFTTFKVSNIHHSNIPNVQHIYKYSPGLTLFNRFTENTRFMSSHVE